MSTVPGWLRRNAVERLWPSALGFSVLALAATFTSAPGRYIGDNRYDQFAAPGRRLARSLAMWDPSRGLGRIREDLWIGINTPLAVLRSLGIPVWATQRIWHAALIALGATGTVALLRCLRPGIGAGHVLAGLVYGFGPYSVVFLLPSNLYTAYAAAPWLVLCLVRGLQARHPWRWAAAFALAAGALGNVDPPGVVYAGMALVPALGWVVLVERSSTWRRAAGWVGRAALLTLGVSAAALYKTAAAASTFAARLDGTESPITTNVASSWAESFRGLGFWLAYFRGSNLARPQTEVLFANPAVILATFAVAVFAVWTLTRRGVRARVLAGALMVLGLVLMVGNYPLDDPSPYGDALVWAYDSVPRLAVLRSTYKAGIIFMVGLAGLVGLGVPHLIDRFRSPTGTHVAAGLAAFAVVVAAATPFWTGSLYDESRGYDEVPAYWEQAISTVDALPGAGRVLVLPATTRTQYRWGWVGDDIFDAMMRRDHAVDTAIPLSAPEAADLLAALTETATNAGYVPGTLGPILRRLGIDRVIVRNDVDWRLSRTARPADLDRFRADSDFELVASFGDSGENTTDEADESPVAERERLLRPVEVYDLVDPGPVGPRGVDAVQGWVTVSGDGEAWPQLARQGLLTGTGPVRYSGMVDDGDLGEVLAGSAAAVVSDTNRRRVEVVSGFDVDASWTLAAGQDLDRPAQDAYRREGTQSVAWFRDATAITADGPSRGISGAQPATRPAAAFDGDERTAWRTFESVGQEGRRLRVELREPTEVGEITVTPFRGPEGTRRVTAGRLHFSDGSAVDLDLGALSVTVPFTPRTTDWIELEVAGVSSGSPWTVGFSEVAFPGLDLREWIALPTDLVDRAAGDPDAAAALAELPLTYQFQRQRSESGVPVEAVLRRRFRVGSPRSFAVTALVRPAASDTRALAESLSDGCTSGQGTSAIEIDGEPVPVRFTGDVADVRPGDSLPVEGCAEVGLGAGWHELEARTLLPVGEVALAAGGEPGGSVDGDGATPPRVRVVASSAGRIDLRVDAPDGGRLLTGQSWDERWTATAAGQDLGAAVAMDTLAGWELPRGTDMVVELRYRPQRRFQPMLALSSIALVLCLWLVLRRPGPRGRPAPDQELPPPQPAEATNSS